MTDDILKITIHYPHGWIVNKISEIGSTRRDGIPEYTLLNIPGPLGDSSLQVPVGIVLSENDKQPSESLLDTVTRHSFEQLYPYQTRYETTLGGRQVVLYWNGYNWLTYYLGNGSNIYSISISNMDNDTELRNVCGIIASLELLQSKSIPLPADNP
jgi:hypothetical protein